MLIQFSVENFLSFDEEQVFSMVASTGDQMHPNHVVDGKGGLAVRAAAIYGPNASGKSNLVEAIRFARELIVNGTRRSQSIPVRPFKLREGSHERPSKFEFNFRTLGVLYNYGFRVTSDRVAEEWLYATKNKKEVKLFERSTSEDGKVEVDSLAEGERKQFFKFLAQGTRPNQLFLTEAGERNVEEMKPANTWFDAILQVISAEPRFSGLVYRTYDDDQFRKLLASFLKAAGTGVEEAEVRQGRIDLEQVFPELDDKVRSALADSLTTDKMVEFATREGNIYNLAKDKAGQTVQIAMRLRHCGAPPNSFEFGVEEQSDGTQRLIQLIPLLYDLQQGGENVVILDELDRRFHPHLSRLFLQTALDSCGVDTSNQLIFTTHDTNLLDLDLLRRDEIWFVEKNKAGASHIYSLAEFKIRPDLKVEKGYLNGRFGAIPFITPIERLGWKSDDPASDDKAAA